MTLTHPVRLFVIIMVAGLALIGGAPATAVIQTYMGDVVDLTGYSYSGPYVYLFLTGPNLDPNGVAIDNIYRPASQGATQVDVDSSGRWEYKWGTTQSGKLDAGVYTVFVADGPADRSHLSAVEFSTIGVDLTKPYISVNGPSQPVLPGTMDLSSIPDGASVVVNDAFRGVTPLLLSGLDPGVYNVSFTRYGYSKLSTPVTVESGSTSEVKATLVVQTGFVSVNSTPVGARVNLDGTDAGLTPVIIGNLTLGNHTLIVTKEGFDPRTLPIQIAGDQTTTVDITFETPPTATVPAVLPPLPTRAAGLLPATLAGIMFTAMIVALNSRRAKK
jgi:hypothetical protein